MQVNQTCFLSGIHVSHTINLLLIWFIYNLRKGYIYLSIFSYWLKAIQVFLSFLYTRVTSKSKPLKMLGKSKVSHLNDVIRIN